MKPGGFLFVGKWKPTVQSLPETGMGYTVVSITLTDGRKFDQVLIDSGYLSGIRGYPDIGFSEDDIAEIKATHDKWNWSKEL